MDRQGKKGLRDWSGRNEEKGIKEKRRGRGRATEEGKGKESGRQQRASPTRSSSQQDSGKVSTLFQMAEVPAQHA